MSGGLLVHVLGPVVISVDDHVVPLRRPLERGLLVRLALARGVGVPDEQLAADLWDEPEEDDGAGARLGRLRVVVSRLRRNLGPVAAAVERVGAGYRLVAELADVRDAAAAADRARAAARAGDHEAARDAAAHALARWRGPALSDLHALPFARDEAERLDAWHLELTLRRLTADIALGAGADVVAELAELRTRHPLHEPLGGMLAVALYRAGRQADALAELSALRRALGEELGVDPTSDTTDLELRLLRHDPGLRPATAAPSRPARRPVPVDIRAALARGIVGRRPELVALAARLDAARDGESSVVLVEGRAGAGRTRLLEALAHLADEHGFLTCWGRATASGGAPAYWPWRQALGQWTRRAGPAAAPLVSRAASPLARILPDVVSGGAARPTATDPDDRFALFEHATAFLEDAASVGAGLVVLLDDVHLADPASLLLLAHLARSGSAAPLLVAASLRPTELASEASTTHDDLVSQPRTHRIGLSGLSAAAVAEQLALVLGHGPDPQVAADVAARTGGNPLFVREVARMMAAGEEGIPTAVRDVVRRQLDTLPAASREVLAAAAVLGGQDDVDVVAAGVGRSPIDVLDQLDVAQAAGLLPPTDSANGVRFANDIVRDAVSLEVGSGERARMHLRAAEHLESTGSGIRAQQIAHHRLEALPLGDRREAVRSATAAADLVLRQFAFEDAARLYGRALDAGSVLNLDARAELLLSKARAEYLSDDVAGAVRSCEEAAGLAEHLGDTVLLARTATTLQDLGDPAWLARVRRWCRTALAALPPQDGALRAQLTAQLAVASSWDDDGVADAAGGDDEDVATAALAMADRLGDTAAAYTALRARQLARSGPDGTAERLGLATRMLGLVPGVGDPAELWGRLWRFDALVQLGRTHEADHELDLLEPVVARMRQPLPRWHLIRSRAALLSGWGRFPEARQAADEAVAAAERGRHRAAEYPAHALRLSIALLTGDPVDGSVFEVERYQPPPRLLSMMAAEWHAAHGDLQEADRIWRRLPQPESTALLPFMFIMFHAVSGAVAAAVDDRRAAEHAYEQLLPYADLHVAAGAGVGATGGSVHLVLGTIAAAHDRTDTAVDHFRAAVAANTTAGLTPHVARAQMGLARQLRRRARSGDIAEAASLTADASATATRIGLRFRQGNRTP